MDEARWEPRQPDCRQYSLTWGSWDGRTHSAEARGLDVSSSGIGIECSCELKTGSIVRVQAQGGSLEGDCEVVHCTRRGAQFQVGLEFREELKHQSETPAAQDPIGLEPDHYETLQISRKADLQTVQRVFRIMAARYHPDNPETGNVEQFLRMQKAFAVLSDPERRAEYDATLEKSSEEGPKAIFGLKDFVTGVEAESNRRLGVLSLLYNRRQTNAEHPGISLLDLEQEMGFPREYLSFTMWFLRAKEFVTVADNSDYAITATGAEHVEEKAVRNEIVSKLLNPGAPRAHASANAARNRQRSASRQNGRFLLPAPTAIPKVG